MGAVRGMLRYGAGGPRQVGQRGGPRRVGNMTFGDGISNYKRDRPSSYGAIQSQFRIDWDAENFKRALNRVGIDGDRFVKDILLELCRQAVSEAKEGLKEMAGQMGDKREADNIYNRVGRALKVQEPEGSTFIRIHTGKNLRDAKFGVRSRSRPSGFLSQIVATGFQEFNYPDNLPTFVKSSRNFKRKTGREIFNTHGMVKRGEHPGLGFYDYMLYIEDYVMTNFKQDIKMHMESMGNQYGFTTTLGYRG
tara:strand:+ start:1107 stop:1856 length:750 start_codon:yes stop_codon:yes gene_type:complete